MPVETIVGLPMAMTLGLAYGLAPASSAACLTWGRCSSPAISACAAPGASCCPFLSAAASGQAASGFLLGLGAIVVPTLVYGLGVAYLGARLREQLGPWRPRIEALSAGLLILVGMNQIIRAL